MSTGFAGQSKDVSSPRKIKGLEKGKGKGTKAASAMVSKSAKDKAKRIAHMVSSQDRYEAAIKRLWPTNPAPVIARALGISVASVRLYARRLGLPPHRNGAHITPDQCVIPESEPLPRRTPSLPAWPDTWPRTPTGMAAVANMSRGWK